MEISKSNIVIFALSKWDGEYSSTTFSLAKAFSKKNKVIYIDKPVTWKDYFSNIFKRNSSTILKNSHSRYRIENLNENLIIFYSPFILPINFLPKSLLYKRLKQINEKIIFKSLNQFLYDIKFKEFIYLNIFNPFFDHNDHLQPIKSIYYTVDNISESAYVKKHGVWLEPELMHKTDLNLATSLMLKKANERYNENIHYLPNAADLQIFDNNKYYDRPKELENIKSDIITFIGHLDIRTDLEIIKTILNNHSNRTVIFIGPISLSRDEIDELNSHSNILFIGSQPLEKIPAFLKYSDCAIIPFKCNELTKGIYPLKINEYLAMGIPVVSTYFSEDIIKFKESISLAKDPQEFSNQIEWEIRNNKPGKILQRIKIAKENTWPKRVNQFWEILNKH